MNNKKLSRQQKSAIMKLIKNTEFKGTLQQIRQAVQAWDQIIEILEQEEENGDSSNSS